MPLVNYHSLPEELYSADAVRAIDRYVIDQQGVDGFQLMQAAAASAFRRLMKEWPEPSSILVLCGAGNNGGDGYLIAASARRHGIEVCCVAVAPTEKLAGDARKAWQKALADGVKVRPLDACADELPFDRVDLIVDAMLGTGITDQPREPFAVLIERCNRAVAPVMAVDVPSGLDSTLGKVAGVAVRADLTVTFIALKAGLFTAQGPEYCGRLAFESLDTDEWASESGQVPMARRVDWSSLMPSLPRRPAGAHKGRFGHVLIVAGERGFGGAGLMAAEAAARSGAGLVSLATRPEHVGAALARCPSLMVQAVTHGSELQGLIDAATVIVCGPGIGQGAWGQQMLQQVIASGKPRVLDADALNLLSARATYPAANQVLTPHPGEAARLLGCAVTEVEADRFNAAKRIQAIHGGVVLLKGAGTVITDGEGVPAVVSGSNPGMATGGMGDVLSGLIGSLWGQLKNARQATVMAASLHLEAARVASRSRGFMGLLPTDVIDCLPTVLSQAENAALVTAGIRRGEE
ncbi:NAD(P)H-hydrate dehydratase [Marinobacter confluentis]|uniref:Bifunctional NAD(P)H-hydrate repair enzyme n=1 Tax=Marinobacter confluentis TaxID=1697557 RepID=A0A4Z1BCW5_9GAMM|nr:NAD(P)H-hydrate dehydratase [Marinobacter confluentis]TGN40064.1 NAD(P)H-hydrate dehydratase [Marinobacter confluentis]